MSEDVEDLPLEALGEYQRIATGMFTDETKLVFVPGPMDWQVREYHRRNGSMDRGDFDSAMGRGLTFTDSFFRVIK
jgi:hypothetical protein